MSNNVTALDNGVGNSAAETVVAWAGYCSTYSYSVLVAALAFLALGLAFVASAAVFEARKSRAEAERVEAEARKAKAEADKAENKSGAESVSIPVVAVTTFVKSFAAVLGDAKAWVAMVLIGLLLLWMAGSAPHLCKSGIKLVAGGDNAADTNTSDNSADDPGGNGAGNAGNGSSGNSAANVQATEENVGTATDPAT